MSSQLDLDSIQPLHSDGFLPPISRWTTLGGLFLVGAFGATVILALIVKYNITVRAIANVRPGGDVQITQANTGGTLKSVEVSENQIVKKGEVIAYIDDPRLYELQNQKRYLQDYIEQEMAQLTQLEAQLIALDTQILVGSGLTPPSINSDRDELNSDISQKIEKALVKIASSLPDKAEQLALQRDTFIQQLDEIDRTLSDAQRTLQRVEAEISKSVVRAPTDGQILKLDIRSLGQTVRPGDVIAQIVPSDMPLIVKARVAAQDIGQVTRGQAVQLRVSAYPYPDYGTLKGKVIEISPDALPCQGNCLGTATAYYEVIIQPESPYLVRIESLRDRSTSRQYPIQPGMEVTADIISRQERVITYIFRKARLMTDF
jgi:HlyD family secretion protein